MKTFYVTTPIYYATDKPHVGHAYTTLAADVLARYWRGKLGAQNVFFLTGTDEHGQKIAQAAQAAGMEPKAFVDMQIPRYEGTWHALNIGPDIFMRTTERGHIAFAQRFLAELQANGYVYKGEYEGVYCVGCEAYKTETELVDGKCPEHPNLEPEHRKEENYFFKLTEFAPKVAALIESGQLDIQPIMRRNEVLARLGGDVRDISISRPGVTWGVPLPWDESHTAYVWVEALLNYASALEIKAVPSLWPPTVQLMGKEILWFHAAIWPALLLAADRALPKTIFAHGWFTVDGQKMSKTLGNVIDPTELVQEWGTDATRYFLLSATTFGEDGNLAGSRFSELYEADLANGLGNLLNRTVTLLARANLTVEPDPAPACIAAEQAIEQLKLDQGLRAIWEIVRRANQALEAAKPWELLKDVEAHKGQLDLTLTAAYRDLESIAAGLAPYLPETSERIFEQLRAGSPAPIFPRKS